jgi:hypothetical protein
MKDRKIVIHMAMKSALTISSMILVLMLLPSTSSANIPPDRGDIKEMQQVQQSVCMTISVEPSSYWLFRTDETDQWQLLAGYDFAAAQSIGEEMGCEYPGYVDCEYHPEDCFDCDGDGIPECVESCVQRLIYMVADLCVSERTAHYSLRQRTPETEDGWYYYGGGTIEIIGAGLPDCSGEVPALCGDNAIVTDPVIVTDDTDGDDADDTGDDDAGNDTGETYDDDSGLDGDDDDSDADDASGDDDDNGGCSMEGASQSPAGATALAMFGAGLCFMLLCRKR